jgi:hypothetical protein
LVDREVVVTDGHLKLSDGTRVNPRASREATGREART